MTTATTEREARILARAQEQEKRIESLESELSSLQSEMRMLKKEIKAACQRRRKIIQGMDEDQLDLPLEEGGAEPEHDDAWRNTRVLDVLDITPSLADKLADAGVSTMGELEDLRAGKNRDYPRGLLDLPKFGQKSLDKLEEQILNWWDSRGGKQ